MPDSSPPPERERFVEVDGLFNVRDIGGYPVAGGGVTRWGLLYRGCQPCGLSALAQRQVAGLGLRTVLDLREVAEVGKEPSTALGITVVSNPIYRGRMDFEVLADLETLYLTALEVGAAEFITALEHLTGPEALPALVHCTAGKDRTGLLIALVLCLLGVDEETVAADYALTEAAYSAERRAEMFARAEAVGVAAQRVALMIGSPPETLASVLTRMRAKYGSIEAYLLAHGARPETLAALRERLIQD
jgi:protein-tyrosine phosphatase